MTTPVYITSTGLEIPTLEDLQSDVQAQQRQTMDPGIDTDPDSPLGQLNGIMMSKVRELWELGQIAYDGLDPDDAEGTLLEDVSAITGTIKADSTSSVFTGSLRLRVNLNSATTVPIGTVFAQIGNPAIQFETSEQIVSVASGDYLVAAECTEKGPVSCNAGTLTVIVSTGVTGLNSVINDFDAILGTDADSDSELRTRRLNELEAAGSGTVDSLRSDILAYVDDSGAKPILTCQIFENATDFYDANNLPPHSLEALIFDGPTPTVSNDIIAQLIWNSKPGGIQMLGHSDTGTATDTIGGTHTVPFTRPTTDNYKITLQISYKASEYAGDPALITAVLARAKLMNQPGVNVRWVDFVSALIYDQGKGSGITGVYDVTNLQLGLVGGAFQTTFTNLVIGSREIAFLDSSQITINKVPL